MKWYSSHLLLSTGHCNCRKYQKWKTLSLVLSDCLASSTTCHQQRSVIPCSHSCWVCSPVPKMKVAATQSSSDPFPSKPSGTTSSKPSRRKGCDRAAAVMRMEALCGHVKEARLCSSLTLMLCYHVNSVCYCVGLRGPCWQIRAMLWERSVECCEVFRWNMLEMGKISLKLRRQGLLILYTQMSLIVPQDELLPFSFLSSPLPF